jgi:hypothetical protein
MPDEMIINPAQNSGVRAAAVFLSAHALLQVASSK